MIRNAINKYREIIKADIRFRRGTKAKLDNRNLLEGEPGFTLDEKSLYVGSNEGNIKFLNENQTAEKHYLKTETYTQEEIDNKVTSVQTTIKEPFYKDLTVEEWVLDEATNIYKATIVHSKDIMLKSLDVKFYQNNESVLLGYKYIDNNTIEVTSDVAEVVTITITDNSAAGPQGLQGAKGSAFVYSDFTQEQLQALVGPQGEVGDKGEQGEIGPQGPAGESYTLPVATTDTLGGVKIGANLSIGADGVLNAEAGGDSGCPNDFGELQINEKDSCFRIDENKWLHYIDNDLETKNGYSIRYYNLPAGKTTKVIVQALSGDPYIYWGAREINGLNQFFESGNRYYGELQAYTTGKKELLINATNSDRTIALISNFIAIPENIILKVDVEKVIEIVPPFEQQQAGATTQDLAEYVGKPKQLVVNTDDYSLHVMDGKTKGGHKVNIPATPPTEGGSGAGIGIVDTITGEEPDGFIAVLKGIRPYFVFKDNDKYYRKSLNLFDIVDKYPQDMVAGFTGDEIKQVFTDKFGNAYKILRNTSHTEDSITDDGYFIFDGTKCIEADSVTRYQDTTLVFDCFFMDNLIDGDKNEGTLWGTRNYSTTNDTCHFTKSAIWQNRNAYLLEYPTKKNRQVVIIQFSHNGKVKVITKDGELTSSGNIIPLTTNKDYIGSYGPASNNPGGDYLLRGAIKRYAKYSRLLSPEEIADILSEEGYDNAIYIEEEINGRKIINGTVEGLLQITEITGKTTKTEKAFSGTKRVAIQTSCGQKSSSMVMDLKEELFSFNNITDKYKPWVIEKYIDTLDITGEEAWVLTPGGEGKAMTTAYLLFNDMHSGTANDVHSNTIMDCIELPTEMSVGDVSSFEKTQSYISTYASGYVNRNQYIYIGFLNSEMESPGTLEGFKAHLKTILPKIIYIKRNKQEIRLDYKDTIPGIKSFNESTTIDALTGDVPNMKAYILKTTIEATKQRQDKLIDILVKLTEPMVTNGDTEILEELLKLK